MAEASREIDVTIFQKSRFAIARQIIEFCKENSLEEIKNIIENLHINQCIRVLNSTINNCLPLYTAIVNNRVSISRYLLSISLVQGTQEMSVHWEKSLHPLIAAVEVGNPQLIELVLQYIPDINKPISGPFTPLMIAIFYDNLIAVKLIVSLGGDVNQLYLNGKSPLMYAHGDSDICSFLILEGADVHHRDKCGYTALHLAVAWDHAESVIVLVNAGADVKLKTHEGLDSLIWTTIHLNMPIFKYLINHPTISDLEKIQAIEVMNACSVFNEPICISGWLQALRSREINNLPKNCQFRPLDILDCSQEFTTEAELEKLQDNPLRLAFQSILVVERILGRNNRIYIQVLLQTALVAKQQDCVKKVRQLVGYIKEQCQETYLVSANVLYFNNLFSAIAEDDGPYIFNECWGFVIFKIIARAAVTMWISLKDQIYACPFYVDGHFSEIVDKFLFMVSQARKRIWSKEYFRGFVKEVKKVLQEDIRLMHQESLLHRVIKLSKNKEWASVELLRFLIEAGADVKCHDYLGRTTVMYVQRFVPKKMLSDFLALFAAYGCRPNS